MTQRAHETLRIAVTFPAPGQPRGPVAMGMSITPDTVQSLQPEHDVVGRCLDQLQRLGFTVTAQGRLSASIRGPRETFEKVFGTSLTELDLSARQPVAGHLAQEAVFFPPDGAGWRVPKSLQGLIDDAYIQWPHIYFQRWTPPIPSLLPPPVTSHHLRVPHDVSVLLDADEVHRKGITGRGVRVAMIDTGFHHELPYFESRGYRSSVALASGATDPRLDGNGHGTGESANLFAVAPDITFIGIKLENEAGGLGASVLEGFQEALRHSPQIITVSLGYDLISNPQTRAHRTTLPNGLRALEAEVAQAVADGIVVVFSAGNGHVAFPGMMPDVISAGGVHVKADGRMEASDYASAFVSKIYPGRKVPDLCGLVGMSPGAEYIMLPLQPGCAIDTDKAATDGTAPNDGWALFSGTSAAAPQLAGVCALLLQCDPHLTPSDVKAILRRSSRDVTRGAASAASNELTAIAAAPGTDGATGSGLACAAAAIRQL
ncbi:MAG: S8 family serine peptidase [Sandaracinaceae bacterium]